MGMWQGQDCIIIMKSSRPVTLANTEQAEFRSEVNGRSYSISVALPLVRAPKEGCPVFYVLDGHWYFASAVEAVRGNAPEVVVVGISYPSDEMYVESVLERHRPLPTWLVDQLGPWTAASLERTYDFSLPASDEALAASCLPEFVPSSRNVGGLDDFLKTLETEVKPRVGAMASIDKSNQAIFGHSLGGLAALHSLFVEPSAYRTFIASSPAIWWNDKAVLSGEARLAEAVRAGKVKARVLITMGSEEDDPRIAARFDVDIDRYAALLRKHRMIENARELIGRLKALRAGKGFEVEDYAIFPKQDHRTAPWPALGRAVSFAFSQ